MRRLGRIQLVCENFEGQLFRWWAAGVVPVDVPSRGRTILEDIIYYKDGISDIALAVAVGITTADFIWRRRWAAFENIIDQVNGVADIDLAVVIGIARPTVRGQNMCGRPYPSGINLSQIIGRTLIGGDQAVEICEGIAGHHIGLDEGHARMEINIWCLAVAGGIEIIPRQG